LFYLNKTCNDFACKDIFDKTEQQLGIKVVYSIVDIPSASYYQERFFYISGPPSMVSAFETNLKKIVVKKSHIKTDYFPGFA